MQSRKMSKNLPEFGRGPAFIPSQPITNQSFVGRGEAL
jgi:hypothetical protein